MVVLALNKVHPMREYGFTYCVQRDRFDIVLGYICKDIVTGLWEVAKDEHSQLYGGYETLKELKANLDRLIDDN
jgi:hypothetical protein